MYTRITINYGKFLISGWSQSVVLWFQMVMTMTNVGPQPPQPPKQNQICHILRDRNETGRPFYRMAIHVITTEYAFVFQMPCISAICSRCCFRVGIPFRVTNPLRTPDRIITRSVLFLFFFSFVRFGVPHVIGEINENMVIPEPVSPYRSSPARCCGVEIDLLDDGHKHKQITDQNKKKYSISLVY